MLLFSIRPLLARSNRSLRSACCTLLTQRLFLRWYAAQLPVHAAPQLLVCAAMHLPCEVPSGRYSARCMQEDVRASLPAAAACSRRGLQATPPTARLGHSRRPPRCCREPCAPAAASRGTAAKCTSRWRLACVRSLGSHRRLQQRGALSTCCHGLTAWRASASVPHDRVLAQCATRCFNNLTA